MQDTDAPQFPGNIQLGRQALTPASPASLDRILIDGVSWTGIRDTEGMAPFFTTSVGDNDVWLFAGSNGALCAGRRDPDLAVFPYVTVDRILDHARSGGALSAFHIAGSDGTARLWEPWSDIPAIHPRRRSLYKHPEGNGLCFEETDLESGLIFRCVLSSCARFGIVRECSLSNTGASALEIRCLDGWHRLVPPGIGTEMWLNFSYLAQAYMRHDRVPGLPMGVFSLNAAITDRAEPKEIQRACAAWAAGLPDKTRILLSTRQLELFRTGGLPSEDKEIRGETGAFLTVFKLRIEAGSTSRWLHCLDTNLDHTAILRNAELLRSPASLVVAVVRDAIKADREGLRRRLAASDGFELSGDATGNEHHLSNTLFNIMRGGIFPSDLLVDRDAFSSWLRIRNRTVADRNAALIAAWPAVLRFDHLPSLASALGDVQLERLAGLYLPLSFSRRHGDPSRPWNRFSIRLHNEEGQPIIAWQGNWRDIFQNWEALALSFPTALPGMISNFLDASTADGYNPYRITSEGIDWEVPNPAHPWSHHGYWGDHQIVYLQRLLSLADAQIPGWIEGRLARRLHVSVEVPYRIAGLAQIFRDPRDTVTFDEARHKEALKSEQTLGTDGRLMKDADGSPLLFSMAEKLLIPLLAKLSNLVPEGGIWLNTQRPEWNDANNALVGIGLSMVTVCQLRRHIDLLGTLFRSEGSFPCTEATADFLSSLASILSREASRKTWDDRSRYSIMRELGTAGERHRERIYRRQPGSFVDVPMARVRELLASALSVIDESIRANRREDGLFHSYNLLELGAETAGVARLQLMLEGQVAVLGSGLLSSEEALALLESLRRSALYREDQHSYILYPDKQVPVFLARNTFSTAAAAGIPLLAVLVREGNRDVVVADDKGGLHFAPDLGNARDVELALDRLALRSELAPVVSASRQALLDLWEQIFSHKSFLGRSGTMFAFEGLGSIYWHMVSKLLLAVQENHAAAIRVGASAQVIDGLAAKYYDIRAGLGPAKSPAKFGAFPTDPYSHTPSHRGAQQPGMTGQVKEELLARRGELGVKIEHGRITFAPVLLRRMELLEAPATLEVVTLAGRNESIEVPAEGLAFTLCQVPVVYRHQEPASIRLSFTDGSSQLIQGLSLEQSLSASLFTRDGKITRIDVCLGKAPLLTGSGLG